MAIYDDFGALPQNHYQVIYLDPPWHYRDAASAGNRGAVHKYPVMDDTDLYKLPVGDLATNDCALFCWGTWPKLESVLCAITCWGFQYKTLAFDWVKLNSKALTPAIGMGNFTRSNTEFVLLATKGKPKRVSASVRSLLETCDDLPIINRSPRREHSRKPDEIREAIVNLMGDVPKVELFARTCYPGWDSWGNEVTKFEPN